jgi:hypothetical protein
LRLRATRKAVTAWTMPGRSGQERVRMKLSMMLNRGEVLN